jgi:CubicO group peptidase (beta-lactamase class C family)
MATSTTAQKVTTTEDPGYAAGWWANRLPDGSLVEPSLPADAYWASGHDGQRLYVVPSEKLVVVRLGFSPKVSAKDLKTTDLVAALITATR